MLTFVVAVFLASLMGSLHCVGMCGPLALWATGGGQHFFGGSLPVSDTAFDEQGRTLTSLVIEAKSDSNAEIGIKFDNPGGQQRRERLKTGQDWTTQRFDIVSNKTPRTLTFEFIPADAAVDVRSIRIETETSVFDINGELQCAALNSYQ